MIIRNVYLAINVKSMNLFLITKFCKTKDSFIMKELFYPLGRISNLLSLISANIKTRKIAKKSCNNDN